MLAVSLLLAVLLTRGVLRRLCPGEKAGCLLSAFVGLVLSILLALTSTFSVLIGEQLIALATKPVYSSTVVSYRAYSSRVHDKAASGRAQSRDVTMYTPVVEFTTREGKLLRLETDVASSQEPNLGETIRVAYEEGDASARELSVRSMGLLLGGLLLIFLMAYVLYACLQYSRGRDMARIRSFGIGLIFYGMIPAAFASLSGGLGYALFLHYSGASSLEGATVGICVFFCVVLFLGFLAYGKLLWAKRSQHRK